MNTTLILETILSLLLAAATTGNMTLSQPPPPPGHNLNHNEILVPDTTLKGSGFTCSPIVCGSNHNQTLVHDASFSVKQDLL